MPDVDFFFQNSDRGIHLKGLDGDRGDQYNFSCFFSDGKRQTGILKIVIKYSIFYKYNSRISISYF